MKNRKLCVLFIHNSLPEYRIFFWRELNQKFNLEILVTNKYKSNTIYGLDMDTSNLRVNYLSDKKIEFDFYLKKFDAVILPPADTIRDFVVAVKTRVLCKQNHIPYFYWSEKWEPSWKCQPIKKILKNYIHKLLIKFASKDCTRYIVSGTKSREYLENLGISANRISIAYDSSISPDSKNTIDIRKKYSIPDDSKIVLFLGRLISRKGCKVLIQAFDKINDKHCYLLIAGSGEQELILKQLALKMDNVIFCGKVQPQERKNYYSQSNLFVLPSIVENGIIEAWGLTVNEALEVGTPVITTTAVGAGYDLIDDRVGFQIDAGKIEELSSAINVGLSGYFDRQECRKRYEKFSVQRMAEQFASIIQGVNE